MDKINFMISSFLSLLVLTGFASATPQSFEDMTGINTDKISKINFTDFGFNEENVIVSESCPRIEVTNNDNVEFTDNNTIVKENQSESIGWFTIDTSEMRYLIVDANNPPFFQFEQWIGYQGYTDGNLVNFETIQGDNNRIALFENDFGFTEYENITIYSNDAVVESLSNQCRVEVGVDDSSQSLVTSLTSTVSNSIEGFVNIIGGFLSVISSVISALFLLITATGNEISVGVMRIFVGGQLIGWMYIMSDFIKDIIPFT